MADTARDLLADRGYRAEPIYLTDLDRVSPASALAPDLRPNTWQTLPYEAEDLHGVLLWAGFESQSPAVTYPMDRRGWHAICVGFHPTTEDQGWLGQVLVKLSGDDTYSMLRWDGPQGLDGHTRRQRFEELFWRVAKLDGQDLVFEQIARRVAAGDGPGTIQGDAAKIAYVKLVPLSDAEAAAHECDLRDASTHRLFGHNDAFYPYTYRTTTAEQIRREVEPYRETDFGRIYWEVGGGDKLYYPTSVGRNPADLRPEGLQPAGGAPAGGELSRAAAQRGRSGGSRATAHPRPGHGVPRQLPPGRLDLSADHDGRVFHRGIFRAPSGAALHRPRGPASAAPVLCVSGDPGVLSCRAAGGGGLSR